MQTNKPTMTLDIARVLGDGVDRLEPWTHPKLTLDRLRAAADRMEAYAYGSGAAPVVDYQRAIRLRKAVQAWEARGSADAAPAENVQ